MSHASYHAIHPKMRGTLPAPFFENLATWGNEVTPVLWVNLLIGFKAPGLNLEGQI